MEMAAGLGSPSTAFYFVFPFGNQSCGCSGQALHLPNLSRLWHILTCKQIPGPSKKSVRYFRSCLHCLCYLLETFGAVRVGAWEQQARFEA